MALLVPLAYSGQPAGPPPSKRTLFLIDHTLGSDFIFWAASHLLKTGMVESILGTPIEDVRAAPPDEQRRVDALLGQILPVSKRARGLRNEINVVRALGPLPLERMSVPTFIASVEDDGYRTWAGARYMAERIPGARFFGLPRGGHLWVGHGAEMMGELTKFLREASAGVQ
jgi:pimeloyl-ACP methyl ester carboxylesterase